MPPHLKLRLEQGGNLLLEQAGYLLLEEREAAVEFVEAMLKSGVDPLRRFASKTDLGKRTEGGKDLMDRFTSNTDLGKRTEDGKDPMDRETGKKGHRR